ncbi:hypothetical protein QCA50_019524 [Cerrena zonata]|uniref:Zn(2)-C6 fungal-type domain-containing protein n=1 Tax=Cerrena zonata TaxID=2478898 RepID=A0AAW0FAH3_9APHY
MSGYRGSFDGSAHHAASADSQNWQTYQHNWRHHTSAQEESFASHDESVTYDSHHHADPDRLGGDMPSEQFAPLYHQGYGAAGFVNSDGTYGVHYSPPRPYPEETTSLEPVRNDDIYGYGYVPASSSTVTSEDQSAAEYSFPSYFSDSIPASPISPTTFNPLSSSALAPLLTHYQSYFSQVRTHANNRVLSPPASSTSASTGSVEGDNELSSDTLYQHACAQQRRSRHDPGGGISQEGKLHTPQEQAQSPVYNQGMDRVDLPVALPTSSALYGATAEVPTSPPSGNEASTKCQKGGVQEDIHGKGKTVERYRSPSPMAHLPYPEDTNDENARQAVLPESGTVTPQSSTSDTKAQSPSSTSSGTPVAQNQGSNMRTTILYSPRTGRRAAVVSGELPEASVKPKRGTPVRIACYFCRRRKIACGGPIGPGDDKTCR